ncbi:MAG: DNA polymerase III subunit gamma/tau [Comamonadaceae bacterium]|nr:DNA polymerase III subunit gamma/tau [Comamonadaceae bacterium]
MSYMVLARKYRPRNFSEMVGQEHVVQALTNALTQQRLHHAYLFTGTRGVGKTTVSRILAKSLNCVGADGQGGITATPCGVCSACTEIDAGRFVDYTELDAASNRGVDEVQQLLEQAVYKPVQGRFKVFMIDEVHMLTNTAFNAMLKTLEEPPEYLKFVIATTDPQKVPVTVLSRCLQFNLRPMAPEVVLDHLGRVLGQENVPAEVAALRLLARAARGSMRDALSLTDQAIAFGSGQVQEAGVRQMLGSVDRGVVFQLIGALATGDGKAVVELSEQLRSNGLSAATTLEDMATVLQRMAVQQAVPDMAVDETDPDAQETARLAGLMPADETQLLYSLCIHGRAELGLAPDEYAGLTMVLLRLLPFKAVGGGATGKASPVSPVAAEKKTLKTAAPVPERPAQDSGTQEALPPAVHPAPGTISGSESAPAPAARTSPVSDELPPRPADPSSDTPAASPQAGHITPALAQVAPPAPDSSPDSGGFAPPDAVDADEPMPADWGSEAPPWEDEPAALPFSPARRPPLPPTPAVPVREWSAARPSTGQGNEAPTPAVAESPVETEIVGYAVKERPMREDRSELTPAAPRPVQKTAEGDFWHALVQDLVSREMIAALVRELALQSELVARTENQWTLSVESESLTYAATRDRLQAALVEAGHNVKLVVEVGAVSDSPSRRNAIVAASRQKAAQELLLADPFVQEMMREFGAKIVSGSVKPL